MNVHPRQPKTPVAIGDNRHALQYALHNRVPTSRLSFGNLSHATATHTNNGRMPRCLYPGHVNMTEIMIQDQYGADRGTYQVHQVDKPPCLVRLSVVDLDLLLTVVLQDQGMPASRAR